MACTSGTVLKMKAGPVRRARLGRRGSDAAGEPCVVAAGSRVGWRDATAMGCRLRAGLHDDVEVGVAEGDGGYVPFFREGRVGDLFELLAQGLLDREDGVGLDVLAPGHEDVRGQRPVPGGGDDEVDVGRAEGVPAGRLE